MAFVNLWPLWVWLGVAVIVSFIGMPADPISMIMALAFGLLCFVVGCFTVSSLHAALRMFSMILGLAMVTAVVRLMFNGSWHYSAGAATYGLGSIVAGAWACRSIEAGRLRILGSFCGGYVIGSFVGPLGTVAGAVLGAVLANRSLNKTFKIL